MPSLKHYTALPKTHLEKARNKPIIKTKPTSTNTPFQIGFASSHCTNETVKKPMIAMTTKPPNTKMPRAMIPAMNSFRRDILFNSL